MTKEQLIEEIRKDTGYMTSTITEIVESTLANVAYAIAQGNDVTLSNFGTFTAKRRAPRTGRNPHTGEAVPINERYTPVFNPSPALKLTIAMSRGVNNDECSN